MTSENIELLHIISQIKTSCLTVFQYLKRDYYTHNDTYNSSGDLQTTLDVKANEAFIKMLKTNKNIKYLASEESTDIIPVNKDGKYIVVFDPLDGSGNINVELSLGSIFAIFKENPKSGRDILFAGYCLYTYKCSMIYSFGNNSVFRENLLNKKTYRVLNKDKDAIGYCCINNKFHNFYNKFEDKFRDIKNFRWTGCMVSDVHRIIVNKGYFCYPEQKLRLLYECYPMAFIISNLGGSSYIVSKDYDLALNILDLPFPVIDIHQKVGILIHNPGYVLLNKSCKSKL